MKRRCRFKIGNRLCKKSKTIGDKCYFHSQDCIICLFRLTKESISCEQCTNIFHNTCIANSGMELCPVCRNTLRLPDSYYELLMNKKRELYNWNYNTDQEVFIRVFFSDLE